jgi:N-acylneuraminate cytidylyltransferase
MLSAVREIDRIIVATDCYEIEKCVNDLEIDRVEVFRRSDDNAQDHSSTESVMLEYIEADKMIKEEDVFILVQATSVFTQSQDIFNGLELFNDEATDSVLSCIESKQFFWSLEGKSLNYDYKNRPRRQDFSGQLIENGAFYISKVQSIVESKNRLSGNIKPVIMPSYTSIELDEPHDWIVAEAIMKKILKDQS